MFSLHIEHEISSSHEPKELLWVQGHGIFPRCPPQILGGTPWGGGGGHLDFTS